MAAQCGCILIGLRNRTVPIHEVSINFQRGWLPWRFGILIIGIALLAPVFFPFLELLQYPDSWKVWAEWDRMGPLLANTLIIALGSSSLAVVLGGITAFLLVRTKLSAQWFWGVLLSAGLFIPLPMLMSGWYLIAQNAGASMPALWTFEARMAGTIFIHGLLGLPWAVLVISLGLLWIEPELEEEMVLCAPYSRVFHRILWSRCMPFVGMAMLLVCWPTWHEITVTDFFKVRTIAEEVYLQLNDGSAEEGPHAVAAALPLCVLMMLAMGSMMRWWRDRCPPRWPSNSRQRRFALGHWQLPAQAWMLLMICLLLFIPCYGLVVRSGMDYSGEHGATWTLASTLHRIALVITSQWSILLHSLVMSSAAGILTSGSAVLLVWLARNSRWLENLFWWIASLLWSLPGPILGLGLLSVILALIHAPCGSFWSDWLYSEPSPLPNIWAAWLRFLPLAWLALWPFARIIPQEWDESAWLDGVTPWQRLSKLYWPQLWRPVFGIAIGIMLLTMGEISASKLVTTPGYLPLSHHLFQQIHAGADTEVAALSLTLLLPVVCTMLGTGLFLAWKRR